MGGPSKEGGLRVRSKLVLIEPQTGRITCLCPECRTPIPIAETAELAGECKPGRRRIVPALPRGEGS